jgi:hypothetical protein
MGGGWAMEIENFLGPVKCIEPCVRLGVPFGAPHPLPPVRKVFLPHCSPHPQNLLEIIKELSGT